MPISERFLSKTFENGIFRRSSERNGDQSRGRVVSERVELGMAKKTGGNEKDEGVLEVVQSLLVTDEEETNSVFNVQKLYINLHYNQNNHHNKQK